MTFKSETDDLPRPSSEKQNNLSLDLKDVDPVVLSQAEREEYVGRLLNSKEITQEWIIDQYLSTFHHAVKPNPKTGDMEIDYSIRTAILKEFQKMQRMNPANQQP
jgi:hypothetical protein